MLIEEIMTPTVRSIVPGLSLQAAAVRMRDWNIGSIPVHQNEEMIGMITDRDICCGAVAKGLDPAKTKVRDIMSKGVTYCFADQECAVAASIMEDKHIRRLLVHSRDGSVVGMVSVDDLARASPRLAGDVLEAGTSAAN